MRTELKVSVTRVDVQPPVTVTMDFTTAEVLKELLTHVAFWSARRHRDESDRLERLWSALDDAKVPTMEVDLFDDINFKE